MSDAKPSAIRVSTLRCGGEDAPVDVNLSETCSGVILLCGCRGWCGAGRRGEARHEEGDQGDAGNGFHGGNSCLGGCYEQFILPFLWFATTAFFAVPIDSSLNKVSRWRATAAVRTILAGGRRHP